METIEKGLNESLTVNNEEMVDNVEQIHNDETNIEKSFISEFDTVLVSKDGEEKKIREILDLTKDVYQTEDGTFVMKHNGIQKLKQFVGATWKEPKFVEFPNKENGYTYTVLTTTVFPNGEESPNIGVASNFNTTGFSRNQKPYMAFKRGYDRSFLRSNTIGLFDVLSEEEVDEIKEKHDSYKTEIREEIKQEMLVEFEIWKKEEEVKKDALLTLPSTDPKYPDTHIIKIVTEYKDADYLEEIIDLYPNKKELVSDALYWKHRIELKRKKVEQKRLKENETIEVEEEKEEQTKEIMQEMNEMETNETTTNPFDEALNNQEEDKTKKNRSKKS